ncbi:hypothetical protein [Rugamonas aquatica]|uniref:Uncharacterized protein n=1 Tax=Rugamonas aquatica TaxID=2743357 RepID=A0A6A7N5F9_9BURK|nr:hypothetical protein [Rugamonas aquatica]MQA40355.1 hypothetical protein [Rugamonas aquatica]
MTKMIQFGLTQKQFTQGYLQSLDGLSAHSIQCISNLLRQPINAAVRSVEFQVFVDAENHGAPSIWVYFIGDNIKTSERSSEMALKLDELDELDDRYFTDFDFGGVNMIAHALTSWFAECWKKAGGWDYGVPAVLDVHDGFGDGRRIQLTEK